MNIFVAKLPPEFGKEDLGKLFTTYGNVQSAKVIMHRETGDSRCFGFVKMPNDGEATKAIKDLNGRVIGSNRKGIVVKEAKPK